MITLVEENMVPLAEEGIISKIEEYGEQYVRMALILNGYTVLDAFQGMLCWSFGDVVTLERLFSLSQYFVCWSFSFSLSLYLSIYLSVNTHTHTHTHTHKLIRFDSLDTYRN
jgi:hypothetical protein